MSGRPETRRIEIVTRSEAHTRRWGARTGAVLRPGVWLALNGELGSGKTVFAQGMAEGLDVPAAYYVTSPTFTLINAYPGRYTFYHADLYRIGDASELETIGFYDLFNARSVVAVEWADRLPADFFKDYIDVRIEAVQESDRKIRMTPFGRQAAETIEKLLSLCPEVEDFRA